MAIDFARLRAPFHPDELEWRVQQVGQSNGKLWAIVLPYVTNRAIQNRLDEVVGPANWKNVFRPGPAGGVLCGLSLRIDGEWITKWDGAENSEIESIKGGLSGAMKRAAVQWGIGRYLYALPETFAVIHEKGRYRAKTADGRAFRWDPPALPAWALPAGEEEVQAARLAFLREQGAQLDDTAMARFGRELHPLKAFIRERWTEIQTNHDLARRVVAAVERARGVRFEPPAARAA